MYARTNYSPINTHREHNTLNAQINLKHFLNLNVRAVTQSMTKSK